MALGVTFLAISGGNAAYAANAKMVTVSVDGHIQQVRSHSATVGDVLGVAHLSVGSHDLLAPAKSSPIKDGGTVVLRRGRQMALTVDGRQRTVWVTATSVQEALGQIGLRATGAVLSADRSRGIPLKGFSLDVRTRKDIQVLDAGTVRRVATNAVVVREALMQMHVKLRPHDKLSLARTARVKDGMVIRITRLDGRRVGEDFAIPFGVERRADSSMYRGQSKVVRFGRVGVLHRKYLLNFVNGKLTQRLMTSEVRTAAPISQVIAFGTKVRPARSVSADGLNWSALARCESGGNPRAVSSGGKYRGLYQFTMGTWYGVGGSGDPIDASYSEQTYRAQLLYRRSGRSPWPVCGKYL
ncbi:MAG: transglycosylase protein [Frankiales bacterium]|nr:transglycosylase protein [Frankiales bacterium]